MKKVALAIAMAALVMFAGCKKDKETTGTTITASIEQQSGNGSRTSIVPAPDDKAEIHWTDGDKIVVNNGTSSQTFNLTAGAGGKTGTFTYNGEYTFSENNIAVYPETSTIGSDGITVTLPANKTLDAPGTGANPMMGIFSDPEQLTFTALGGALGIGLKGDNINITAVEIVSNANEQLNGTFTCTTSNPQINVTPSDDADAKKMRLTCTTTLTATPQYFYFPLPVGALAEGFTLNVYGENNELVFNQPTTGNTDVTVAWKTVNQMPDLTVTLSPESFTVNFENGLPEGWTTIDADGDGYNWVLDTEAESAYGYNQSNAGFNGGHMILSGSYHKTAGALHPNNYLVSPKVTLRSGSTFSFWAGAQDYQYPAEHFGVCVSDNGTSDWTMVQEWTMEAKGASGDKGFGRDGNTRDQGRWYYFSVDLSAYAGQRYIAIRHFNCSDQFFLNVDNIRLGDPEPGGTSFSQNFNNSVLPEGWTTIDADGDGYNWVLTTQTSAYGYSGHNDGHYGTVGMTSGSYHGSVGALTPDNYLVTPKVNLVQGSTFSFWACAQDASYPAEHFGVYVSDNGTSDWTVVQEWTMTAKGASGNKGNGRDGNTRDIGNWYQYTVDLSAYAGEKYIAIRHFNCSDEFFLEVDDILLTVNR